MLAYIIKKIILLILAMLILAVIVFFLSEMAPGDKVMAYLDVKGSSGISQKDDISEKDYHEIATFLHLDLPSFYFSIEPKAYPANLYTIVNKSKKKLAKSLYLKTDNPEYVKKFFEEYDILLKKIKSIPDSIKQNEAVSQSIRLLHNIKNIDNFNDLTRNISELNALFPAAKGILPQDMESHLSNMLSTFDRIKNSRVSLSEFMPSFKWHGVKNRFHIWFSKVLKLDFGISAIDGQSISKKIAGALKWTFLYIFIAYILTFGLAFILGIASAYYHKKKIVNILDILFSGFYSIPLFWLATLAVVFLTSDEVLPALHIFPSTGIGDVHGNMNFWEQIKTALPHLILPSLLVALHSGAYLSTLLKRNMLKEMRKKYYMSFFAKGFSKKQVILKHILPNSILPLITIFIVSLPASLSGSIVMEVIFNIPGMGRLFYDSILMYDWYVVYTIVLLIGMATYLSYTIGDIIYNYFNPKMDIVR